MKETTLFSKKLHLGWQPKFPFKKGRTHTILKISFFLFLQAIFYPSVSAQTVEVWWSAGSRSNSTYPLEQQNDLIFEDPDNSSVDQVIAIDHDERYQQMLGHGISMEHSTIYNLNRMSPEAKEEALRALFDPVEGLGIDWVRLCLGALNLAWIRVRHNQRIYNLVALTVANGCSKRSPYFAKFLSL